MPRAGFVLPTLSGLLLAASFPPFHLLLPPFVALVPFILGLRSLPADRRGAGEAFRAGGVLGLVYFGLLLAWLVPALTWLTALGPLLFLVVLLLLAAIPAGVGWCVHRLVRSAGVPLVLAVPLAWSAGEWLRGSLPGGIAFPWLGLGTSLTAHPEIVGIAELVGARGVTFWLVLVNALVAELVTRFVPAGSFGEVSASRAEAPRDFGGGGFGVASWGWPGLVGVLTVVVILPAGWGLWRAETLPIRSAAPLALVRTDVSAEAKETPGPALETTGAQLLGLGFGDGRRTLGEAAMMVWPETVFPFVLPAGPAGNEPGERAGEEGTPGWKALDLARAVAGEEGAPLLFGGLDRRRSTAPEGPTEFNAAFLVDASEAGGDARAPSVSVVYRKRYLVPLVERSPSLLPGGWTLGSSSEESIGGGDGRRGGGLASGGPVEPVPVPGDGVGSGGGEGGARGSGSEASRGSGLSFGVLICFESAFPAAARSYRSQGADLLVNLTNDVWFGDGDGFLARVGARQHEAHMIMRAVENRMGVARSANGGGTFFVDPAGRVYGRAGDGAALTVEEARISSIRTLYSRTGDWVGPGSAAGVLALLLLMGWRRTRGRHPAAGPPG